MARFHYLDIPLPEGQTHTDYSSYWQNGKLLEETTFDNMGVAMIPSGFYHFWGYVSPLRNAQTLAELEKYPIDDFTRSDGTNLKCQTEQAHREGKIVIGWVGHMYECAWQIRGYEQFLMDMIEQPAWAECMLDKLTEQNMIRIKLPPPVRTRSPPATTWPTSRR